MDNYPEHLAPEFEEGGGVATPFDEWWPRVRGHFARVPEEAARYWLHEHWSHSPFSYLPSDKYRFAKVQWPAERLSEIRTTWNDFKPSKSECLEHGRFLVEEHHKAYGNRCVAHMLEHGDFPTPIIVLDNRDGHLPRKERLPLAHILIEGHRRFNRALYLHSTGRLNPTVSVWLMERD